jgi:hypothetical protein
LDVEGCAGVGLQAGALQELQKRFEQQEHQLQAATATAASTNGSEGVQVEPYFPEDKVQQELTMLHKVCHNKMLQLQQQQVSAAGQLG